MMGASGIWLLMPLVFTDDHSMAAVLMTLAMVGALVPDLDAVESKIEYVKVIGIKPLVPVSRAINRAYGHRGPLHSLWGWLGWSILILPTSVFFGWLPTTALSLGYASHLPGDSCTRTGILLLFPKRKSFHLLPVKWRVVTGTALEELFFVAFALISLTLLLRNLSLSLTPGF